MLTSPGLISQPSPPLAACIDHTLANNWWAWAILAVFSVFFDFFYCFLANIPFLSLRPAHH